MPAKKKKKLHTYVKDLRNMAQDCYDICKPDEGKSCEKCPDILKCMNGLRNAIGDIAETLAWTLEQINILDKTLEDVVKMAHSDLEELADTATEIKKKKKTKKVNANNKNKEEKLPHDVNGFYT